MRKGVVIIGAKGCYGFHRGGVDKLTYNHSDSYPEGVMGADIVEFVRPENWLEIVGTVYGDED